MTTQSGERASATYTHGHAESVLRSHRWRTATNSAAHLAPLLRPGQRLLDLGSGPGTITAELAALVAPGPVTAVEIDEAAAGLTRAGLAAAGVADAVVVVADAHELPFDDGSFDVAHAHQVLQHVADPVRVLAELRRVTRPGGVVAVRDSDYAGFAWHPQPPGLGEWLAAYRTAARANGGEPDAGRRLLGWAQAAGLREMTATSSTWCFAEPAARQWWAGLWCERITGTALGRQLLADGLADAHGIAAMVAGWQDWAASPDGWFSVLHGELVARV